MSEQVEGNAEDLEVQESVEEQEISPELRAKAAGDPQIAGFLSDLKNERTNRKALSTKVQELETKAQLADRLSGEVAQMRAQLEALAPDAEAMRRLPPEIAEAARRGKPADPDISDEDAAATARNYGLFDLQGNPDTKAGRKIQADMRKMVAEEARRITKAEVEPYRQMTLTQQAGYLANLARQRASEGYCKPDMLEQVLATLTVEQQADQNAMNAALVLARGIGGPGAAVDTSEPMYLESSGGRRGLPPGPLSDLERRVVKDKGLTEQDWKESVKDYTPGQAFRLE